MALRAPALRAGARRPLRLTKKPSPEVFGDGAGTPLTHLLRLLPTEARGFGYTRKIFPDRLLVLRDEDFKELTEVGTEVLTRIKLNDLGTTTTPTREQADALGLPPDADLQGNLFVQEVVPPETLFLCALRAHGEHSRLVQELVKLPARLHTSGLGQTVAFYLASGEGKPEWEICAWLERWLRQAKVYGDGPLITWITGSAPALQAQAGRTESLYRQASAEARALAVWLKRFAEAYLEGEKAE